MIFARLKIYLIESYKPMVKIIPSFLGAGAIILTQSISTPGFNDFAPGLILTGGVMVSLFLLYVRIADEFKDYEIDLKYFPLRPIPSGRVLLSDLRILKWLTIISILLISFIWTKSFLLCLATMSFFLLTEVWFFMPKLISNNRLLAFFSHTPAYWLMNFYVVSLFVNWNGLELFTKSNLLLATWFTLPGMAWEFARKTRAPDQEEEGYQTYSAMIGYFASTLVTILIVLLQLGLLVYMNTDWAIHKITLVALSLSTSIYIFSCISFLRDTTRNEIMRFCGYHLLCSYILIISNALLFTS